MVINKKRFIEELSNHLSGDSKEYKTLSSCIASAKGYRVEDGYLWLSMGMNMYYITYPVALKVSDAVAYNDNPPLTDTDYLFEVDKKGRFV